MNKSQQNNNNNNKNTHLNSQTLQPSLFSISIFSQPQEFIALFIAIQSSSTTVKIHAAKYLECLLRRTKSPPIALTYTKEFLLLRTESEIQLAIIRFISQLSDLSSGKSMQSSLSFIIDNSSFLTQLRHNLTHRVMVKGLVIERGRQMILHQLKEKYWKVMFDKIWNLYYINKEQVETYFNLIYENSKQNTQDIVLEERAELQEQMRKSKVYLEYQLRLQQQTHNKLTTQYLFKKCQSNYQFKNLIKPYISKNLLPSILTKIQEGDQGQNIQGDFIDSWNQVKKQHLYEFISPQILNEMNNTRVVILLHTMLEVLLTIQKYKCINQCSKYRHLLSGIIAILVKSLLKNHQESIQTKKKPLKLLVLINPLILKKIRQIYLFKYISEFNHVLEALPEQLRSSLDSFWASKPLIKAKNLCN